MKSDKTLDMIAAECDAIRDLLLRKHREYGNSVFEPVNIFAQADAIQQIEVRIDDKIKRIKTTRGMSDVKIHEDTEQDLIGYLIILRVARRVLADNRPPPTPTPYAGSNRS